MISTLNDLKTRLEELSPVGVEFVAKIVDALSNSPRSNILTEGTWLTSTGDWVEYFGSALSVHHSTTSEPPGHTGFENVFKNACEYMGWAVSSQGSATQRFVDMTITDHSGQARNLSLKSTAAKGIREASAHISKLTEAAWIQDARTPGDRRQKTLELFQSYQDVVSEIMMLRAFRDRATGIPTHYQLIEIPASLFDSIQQAPVAAFNSDAPVIECLHNGHVVAHVALDRSDAKITVRRIATAFCTIHAEWMRPL